MLDRYRLIVRDAQGVSLIETGNLSHLALRVKTCDYYPGVVHPVTGNLRERRLISSVEIEGPIKETMVPSVDHTYHRDTLRDAASDLLAACEGFLRHSTHYPDSDLNRWADTGLGWAKDLVTMRAAVRKAKNE